MKAQELLFQLQDKGYRDFQSKLIPTIPAETIIGVRIPAIRKLAKEYGKDPESVEFLKQLPHTYYDENILHALLVAEIKDYEVCVKEVERFLPYKIPNQFRYDYTETTPENLYQEEGDKILADLKKRFVYKGLDGCRMRNGYHFDYKGLHMTYHKTLPYSTIVETGDDGVTYDILYDILIKQTGEIHSDWTGVKLDVDAYRKVVYEPYDLCVREGTIDF